MKYKRVLLKLSGEALAGEDKIGINAKTVADIAETDAALDGLLAHTHLFAAVLGRDAHHIALGEDVVLHELHVPDGAEGLLVVAADGVDVQQHYARERGVGADILQVLAQQDDAVLGHQGGVRRDAGAVARGQVAPAQLIGGVAREHQLVGAVVRPGPLRLVAPAPGAAAVYALFYLADCAVVELHIRTGRPSACGRGTC